MTKRHLGALIKAELETQERGVSWLAKKLSCDRSNVYRIFQKKSLDTQLLARISKILNRDFFAELSATFTEEQDSHNLQQ